MGTRLEGERPRREVSGESRPADTCVWDFRSLELRRRTFPLFKPPVGSILLRPRGDYHI